MNEQEKISAYHRVSEKINALLVGEQDEIACMASICSVLAGEFETFYWTGFYRLIDGKLVVGPYQGPLACAVGAPISVSLSIKAGAAACVAAAMSLFKALSLRFFSFFPKAVVWSRRGPRPNPNHRVRQPR